VAAKCMNDLGMAGQKRRSSTNHRVCLVTVSDAELHANRSEPLFAVALGHAIGALGHGNRSEPLFAGALGLRCSSR
jgi:hypothetical protein